MKEFITAVYRKDYKRMEELLRQGFDINSIDDDGRSVLMHAVLDSDASEELINFLLQKGVNVNATDKNQSWSALHFAVQDNKMEIVDLLLKSGANVNIIDGFGNTPLWRSVMGFTDDVTLVKLLLDYGADPSIQNQSGVSPLILAERMGKSRLIELFSK